ncbi:exonuclease [Pectobacterium phage DU_PP_II]|uniref:Exonuclease n=1 Tax=Pectobacterium phage DU_PP_II TaxID=2041489 RepID=A0A2D2W699_9CAUD|nr:exonuclease [Pectobacterium phage DU_PP_II]ATS93690.1 exonuclease [Pectobacterium phage DU_PP_II]
MAKPLSLLGLSDELASRGHSKGILVMDGDWMVFQAMSAAEYDASWDEEIWMRCCDHAKAREILEGTIASYASRKAAWKGAPIILAFTDKVNWRKELVDPTYKENRKATKKPVGYFEFVDALYENPKYLCVREDNLEGDDCMGIIGSNPLQFEADKAVLVSCDKDFKTIPDCDFLWCTTGNILKQTLESADYWHMYQTMKGDITDGYSGIPQCGETFVEEFLKEPYMVEPVTSILKSGKNKGQEVTRWEKRPKEDSEGLWDCIVSIAAKAGMSPEDVLKQAQMARILRATDYNIETKEITLWTP